MATFSSPLRAVPFNTHNLRNFRSDFLDSRDEYNTAKMILDITECIKKRTNVFADPLRRDPSYLFKHCAEIVTSMDDRVLDAILNGTFHVLMEDPIFAKQQADREAAAKAMLTEVGSQTNKEGYLPCIYLNCPMDPNGKPFTPKLILEEILPKMERYVSDVTYRAQVDKKFITDKINSRLGKSGVAVKKWDPAHSTSDRSRICGVESTTGPHHFSATAKLNIRYFCQQVRWSFKAARIVPGDSRYTLPADIPFMEWGYATRWDERKSQHERMTSSNYIMNLLRVIAKYEFPGQDCVFKQWPIYWIHNPEQCAVAEAFFTESGLGYCDIGIGFAHCPAGQNVRTPLQVPIGVYNFSLGSLGKPFLKRLTALLQDWNDIVKKAQDHKAIKDGTWNMDEEADELRLKAAKRIDILEDGAEMVYNVERLRKQLSKLYSTY